MLYVGLAGAQGEFEMVEETNAKIAGVASAGVGVVASLGLVSTTGAVGGLGATGITSGLAAVGGVVGGGMLTGLDTIALAPIAFGLTGYAAYRWLTATGSDREDE